MDLYQTVVQNMLIGSFAIVIIIAALCAFVCVPMIVFEELETIINRAEWRKYAFWFMVFLYVIIVGTGLAMGCYSLISFMTEGWWTS